MTSRRKQDEFRHTVRVPRRAFGRGARARARRACRSAGLRRARIRPHRDADARGHGRHAGRRAAARLAVSVLRRAWRPAGHASRRDPAGGAHVRHAPGRRRGSLALPLHPARVPRGGDGDAGHGARAHADRHRVHRRGRHAGRRGGGEPSGAGARGCRRALVLAGRGHGGRAARAARPQRRPAGVAGARAGSLPCVQLRGARPADGRGLLGRLARGRERCSGVRPGRAHAGAHPGRSRGHRPGARARGAARLRGRAGRLRPHVRRPGRGGAGRPHPGGLLGHELVRLLYRHRVRSVRPPRWARPWAAVAATTT